MIPNPSHPRSSNIVWGNIIKNIIDKTNNNTKIINRSVVLSFAMYVLVNCMTLVAIINTVVIKIVLVGSRMIGNEMFVLLNSIMFHSINKVD